MTALTVLLTIVFLWAILEFIWGSFLWYQRRRIRHDLRVEITQRHFAEARNQLMVLAQRGEVDPNSFTFAMLYNFNTALMRRPDEYPAMGARIRRLFMLHEDGAQDPQVLEAERKNWHPGVKEVLKQTSEGMHYIIVNHSRFWRWLYKCRWFLNPPLKFLLPKITWLQKYIESKQRQDPVVAEIRDTKAAIDQLLAAA